MTEARDRSVERPFRPSILLLYLLSSLAVAVIWTHYAKTEVNPNRYSSIVAAAEGTAPRPFVTRRLIVDSAIALAPVVPQQALDAFDRFLETDQVFARRLRREIREHLGWQRRDDALLLSAHFLIWMSVLGFMDVCRRLTHCFYAAPEGMASLAGFVLGCAMLGGFTDWHYQGYPYDFPNAFVFGLTLLGIARGRLWWYVAFLLAVYSKETSVLLVPAYAILARRSPKGRFWADLATMVFAYILVRGGIALLYLDVPRPDFFAAGRNTRVLLESLAFDSWYALALTAAMLRFWSLRRRFPPQLLRLLLLGCPLVALGFFWGWIEEIRQYMELLPVAGLLCLHWILIETDREPWMVPRPLATCQGIVR